MFYSVGFGNTWYWIPVVNSDDKVKIAEFAAWDYYNRNTGDNWGDSRSQYRTFFFYEDVESDPVFSCVIKNSMSPMFYTSKFIERPIDDAE